MLNTTVESIDSERASRAPDGGWLRILAAAAGLALLGGCGNSESTASSPPPPEVRVATVTRGEVPIVMRFPGTVQAYRQVTIIPRVSGYIMERRYTEGAFVEQGDLLYVIDPRPFEAQLAAAQAQLERDQASVQFWKEESVRYDKLVKSGAGSVEDQEKAQSTLAEFKASVAADQANIEEARLNLSYTSVTAPFPGRVDNTRLYQGALVTAQQSELTDMVQLDPIHVIFSVSRARFAEVQKLQTEGNAPETLEEFTARLTLPDGASFDQEGRLDFMSNTVNSNTDSVVVRALFRNPVQTEQGLKLVPGQYVPIDVTVGRRPAALTVPQQAVQRTQSGDHVLVVGKDDKVATRKVTILDSHKHRFVVSSGLEEGERVIVEGLQRAKAGSTVKPVAAGSAPQSTPQKSES